MSNVLRDSEGESKTHCGMESDRVSLEGCYQEKAIFLLSDFISADLVGSSAS